MEKNRALCKQATREIVLQMTSKGGLYWGSYRRGKRSGGSTAYVDVEGGRRVKKETPSLCTRGQWCHSQRRSQITGGRASFGAGHICVSPCGHPKGAVEIIDILGSSENVMPMFLIPRYFSTFYVDYGSDYIKNLKHVVLILRCSSKILNSHIIFI